MSGCMSGCTGPITLLSLSLRSWSVFNSLTRMIFRDENNLGLIKDLGFSFLIVGSEQYTPDLLRMICILAWFFKCSFFPLLNTFFAFFFYYLPECVLRLTERALSVHPSPPVSHYTNAFAYTQLCAVLFAPVSGLIMDRHKRKPLAPGWLDFLQILLLNNIFFD